MCELIAVRPSLSPALLILLFAGTAVAGTQSYFGNGGNLNVATFDGMGDVDEGTTIFTIPVSDTYVISVGDAVTVDLTGLQYPYVGDLRATLTLQNSLNQVLATGDIFNQIGAYNPGDPGDQGQFGNSGSIDSGNYSFNSSYTADIWNAACCQGSSDSLPSGSYYTTTALSDNNDELSSMFAGQAVTGTWVLTIYDYYPPFNGIYPFPYNPSIGSWSLDITTTPEPSMIILTALAGVLLWGIRRRAVNSR